MTDGYLYCLSNESMPGLLKVGMTSRTPEDRAKELFTTGVPLPFKIEFAKKIKNTNKKEGIIHNILSQYKDRINPRREFFRVPPEEVKALFDLIDGEEWIEKSIQIGSIDPHLSVKLGNTTSQNKLRDDGLIFVEEVDKSS